MSSCGDYKIVEEIMGLDKRKEYDSKTVLKEIWL